MKWWWNNRNFLHDECYCTKYYTATLDPFQCMHVRKYVQYLRIQCCLLFTATLSTLGEPLARGLLYQAPNNVCFTVHLVLSIRDRTIKISHPLEVQVIGVKLGKIHSSRGHHHLREAEGRLGM